MDTEVLSCSDCIYVDDIHLLLSMRSRHCNTNDVVGECHYLFNCKKFTDQHKNNLSLC